MLISLQKNLPLFVSLCMNTKWTAVEQQQQHQVIAWRENKIKIFDTRKSLKAFSPYHLNVAFFFQKMYVQFYSIIFYLDFNFFLILFIMYTLFVYICTCTFPSIHSYKHLPPRQKWMARKSDIFFFFISSHFLIGLNSIFLLLVHFYVYTLLHFGTSCVYIYLLLPLLACSPLLPASHATWLMSIFLVSYVLQVAQNKISFLFHISFSCLLFLASIFLGLCFLAWFLRKHDT